MALRRVALLGIWLVCVALLALLFGGQWAKFSALVDRGVPARGVVVKKEPANHRFVTYTFLVGGQEFRGMDNAWHGVPTFDELAVGDPVAVVYDPTMPNVSLLGEARPRLRSATLFMILVLATAPVILTYGTWLTIQGRQQRNSDR